MILVMKIAKMFATMVLFTLVVSGCISSSNKANSIDAHIAKAESLEKESRFSSALEQYKLALTIDPKNEIASQRKEKLQLILKKSAQAHYLQGLEFDKQGKYDTARKEYLAALQNWPEHKEAKEKLTPGNVAGDSKEYITHTLAYGDSVSKLGMVYYKSFKKHHIIGKFNQLKDATKVRIGQKLKIPVTESVSLKELKKRQAAYFEAKKEKSVASKPVKQIKTQPMPVIEKEIKTEPIPVPEKKIETQPMPAQKKESKPKTMPLPKKDIKEEPVSKPEEKTARVMQPPAVKEKEPDSYTQGVELFNKKKYPEAISFFLAAKETDPEDETLRDYLFKSHFQQGILLFNSEDYLSAKENFESALDYNKTCDNCPEYIEKCETTYKEKHYNLGIHYFGKEQLSKAIEEWKRVKSIDPDYKDVTPNLKKAILLNKRLENIKQSKTE